ncbi:MAG: InlB B-repeat-containing protein, partial [Bacilli bacterium]|nr:InlB B-repeat-containing protein [Bacilli bacterium]
MNNKLLSFTFASLMTLSLVSCANKSNNTGSSIIDDGLIHVTFDTNTELKTNNIKEQVFDAPGQKLKEPVLVIISDNPDNLELYGWYTEKTFEHKWDFNNDLVEHSMTLYARYLSQRTVNYYQGLDENNMNLIGTETVFDGEAIPEREDLPDCYENLGMYHLSNVTKNDNGTYSATKGGLVNLESDVVTATTDVLYQRSENIYFHSGSIKRRFTPIAANEGNDGSTPGSIEEVTNEAGEKYAKVNFGWAKTVSDPRILMDNPRIDVTKSQSLEITMKNIGPAQSLTFYWVGKWADGSFINGKEYHSFNEMARYTFMAGTKYSQDTANTCYHDENGETYKYNQKESDDWTTYRIPIYKKLSNGVSTWGNAQWITALVIQSGYSNKDNDDNKNTLLIKSIRGVSNDSYQKFDDSSSVTSLKSNDSTTALNNEASSQEAVNGFIFPKDNNSVTKVNNATVYKKVDGIYVYGTQFGGKETFRLQASRNISLDGFTTLKFKYTNYSYVSNISFMFGVEYVNE